MTPDEAEVIEAAKACREEWRINGRRWDSPVHNRLERAVDALPKPAPSLVERLRSQGDDARHRGCSAEAALLREAADELERRG